MGIWKSPFAEAAVQPGTVTVGSPSLEGVQDFASQSPLCWWLTCSVWEAGLETPHSPTSTSLSPRRQGTPPQRKAGVRREDLLVSPHQDEA